ncbi:hypothetical protein C2G38_2162120 [Gigaspora rosea]|uniref:Uncharacterized protein n=1 Tax=Gigaspora rosea TaxID=44941 RepID=A0A397VYF6_9GLOM|nr:hypothetical protein C2G38_2162120 [Gigaspora rosea]
MEWKLAALASEFNLTYIAATLRANSYVRHAKRIKLFTEICAPSSKIVIPRLILGIQTLVEIVLLIAIMQEVV